MLPPAVPANPRHVLRFPGGSAQSQVNHGKFWPQNGASTAVDLGAGFFWHSWCAPYASGYFISDGWGGAHALLIGANTLPGGLQGEVVGTAGDQAFGCDYRIQPGEWLHWALGWKTTTNLLYLSINGILDGVATCADRLSVTHNNGGGELLVGGSDHQNGDFKLAFIGGWDRDDIYGAGSPTAPFVPERFPGYHTNATAGAGIPIDFYADYTWGSGNTIPDLSPQGVESRLGLGKDHHPGVFANVSAGQAVQRSAPFGRINTGPTPYWVRDASCPAFRPHGSPVPLRTLSAVPSVPGGALIYDSFTRQNQNHAFHALPVLGSTEGGSLGPQVWTEELVGSSTNNFPGFFGIHDEYAVMIGSSRCIAHVDCQTANHDVRVSRRKTSWNTGEVTAAARIQDRSNFFLAHYYSGVNQIQLHRVTAGVATLIGFGTPPASWTVLRLVASGTTLTVYADATQVVQVTGETAFQSATRVGMANETSVPSSLTRWKHFTVYAA